MYAGELKSLGFAKPATFNITSGRAVVSDPCYDRGTWCAMVLDKVRTGQWFGSVEYSDEGSWGVRTSRLIAWHSDLGKDASSENIMPTELLKGTAGVDSGQMCIFDDDKYKMPGEDGKVADDGDDPFYEALCAITLGEMFEDSRGRMNKMIEHGAYVRTGETTTEHPERPDDGSFIWMIAMNDKGEIIHPNDRALYEKLVINDERMASWYQETGEHFGAYKDHGVVSSTGFGDGAYDVFVQRDNDEITAIEVVFLVTEDEDEEEETTEEEATAESVDLSTP